MIDWQILIPVGLPARPGDRLLAGTLAAAMTVLLILAFALLIVVSAAWKLTSWVNSIAAWEAAEEQTAREERERNRPV